MSDQFEGNNSNLEKQESAGDRQAGAGLSEEIGVDPSFNDSVAEMSNLQDSDPTRFNMASASDLLGDSAKQENAATTGRGEERRRPFYGDETPGHRYSNNDAGDMRDPSRYPGTRETRRGFDRDYRDVRRRW